MDKKTIIVYILATAIGFGIGFGVGVAYMGDVCLDKGLTFLQNNGVNITINSEQILNAFMKYRGT